MAMSDVASLTSPGHAGAGGLVVRWIDVTEKGMSER